MKRLRLFLLAVAFGIVLAACGGGAPPIARTSAAEGGVASVSQWQANHSARRACPETRSDELQCDALIIKTGVQPDMAGFGPSNLQAAYNLPSSSKGKGEIVAIVDAYDNPNVASDLATYRSHFGLPAANFTKYNQEGQQRNYPEGNEGWGVEIDLDVEMVSASCPNCTIYLIEANNNDNPNLAAAETEAVALGAHIISNSYSAKFVRHRFRSHYDSPGVVYLASAGDDGYVAGYPAAWGSVIAVGGTILAKNGSKYKEVVWPLTGGGCADHVQKPSWQHDPSCPGRTQNDVAAVANGVAEYDSYGYSGWMTTAGTSVSSPLVAGVYGLAGNASAQHAGKKLWTLTKQALKKDLHVISRGSDGACGGSYLCTAGTGQYGTYSGPTGWGTPNGIGAF